MSQFSNPGNRILIVDDNELVHDDFRKVLCGVGSDCREIDAFKRVFFEDEKSTPLVNYHLDFAFQGEEALEMVRRASGEGHPYRLAFIDMRMPPGWDGLRTMIELRKVDSNIQFVVCSAYSDYDQAQLNETLGVQTSLLHLSKPFSLDEVRQVAFLFATPTDAHLT